MPDEYMGDIMGDMNKRRGRIMGMNQVDGLQQVEAEAPLAEMFKYATDLRSMTQARGSFTMEFERYEEVPADVAKKIIESRQAQRRRTRKNNTRPDIGQGRNVFTRIARNAWRSTDTSRAWVPRTSSRDCTSVGRRESGAYAPAPVVIFLRPQRPANKNAR